MLQIIIVGISVIALIILLIMWKNIRKNKKKQEMLAQQVGDKLREEALDKIILNEKARTEDRDLFSAKPIEVNYDAAAVEKAPHKKPKGVSFPKTMLKLVENSELSARTYMFDPQKGVHIGKKKGKNDIIIADPTVDDVQCEITSDGKQVYVRNPGTSGKAVLKRGSQQAYVEKKYIELKNNDVLLIGNTLFRVELIKSS